MKKKLTFEIYVSQDGLPLRATSKDDWDEAKAAIDEYLLDHHNIRPHAGKQAPKLREDR